MSFLSKIGEDGLRQVVRKRRGGADRSRQAMYEAARFSFCVYFGIPVRSIRVSFNEIRINYNSDKVFSDQTSLGEHIQMIMSGAVATQTISGGENPAFESAVSEANQLHNLAKSNGVGSPFQFDHILSACCKRAIAHLADPKMIKSIAGISRVLARERSDIKGASLERLIAHARSRLSGDPF